MKKLIGKIGIITQLIFLVLLVTPALAADPPAEPGIQVYVDDALLSLDVAPVLQQNRTLVPLRGIFEALGAQVEWNGQEKSVSATKGTSDMAPDWEHPGQKEWAERAA